MEVVSLDDMDGFEFQQFVAHLFERLGFGRTEEIHQTRDAGRDVVMRSPDGGLIVVECKHHPKGTVGRPVVQKLHSAVVTAQAKKRLCRYDWALLSCRNQIRQRTWVIDRAYRFTDFV